MGSRCAARLLSCLVFAALPGAAYGQSANASITGLVTDASGAAVAGVKLTAANQGTTVTYVASSNQAGHYAITSVPVGTYVVKAERPGFRTTSTRALVLEAKQVARLDIRLELGALEDVVAVETTAPALQTESATVGEVFSAGMAGSLPLNGRNPAQLALLLAGSVTPNPRAFADLRNLGSGRPFVNGNREQTNNFTLDGVDMNESIENFIAYQPSPDALAEVSVETSNWAADTGNAAGAVVSNVLKSGTNQFRGSMFELYRNSALDANLWENNRSGTPRPERTRHVYGATLGGPILKDKLFFFADFQGTQQDAPGSQTFSVAPAEWRRGDLSGVGTPIIDPLSGLPFPGNRIPQDRIGPVARAILGDTSLYPLPNRNVDILIGNFVGDYLATVRARQGDVRLDWNASADDKLFARFSYADYESGVPEQAIPVFLNTVQQAPFRNLALYWNRVLGASFVSELTLGYNQVGIRSETVDWAGIGDANARFGIPGGQPIPGLSSINWGGGIASIGGLANDSNTLNRTYQVSGRLSGLKGRHALRFGGEFLYFSQRRSFAGNNGLLGYFDYTGGFSGFAFADFLLDQVAGKGRGSLAEPWTHLHGRYAFFGQDDFKLRDDLTLNIGLRWSYAQPWVERDDRQSNFDLTTGYQVFARAGSRESRALYKRYHGGFEPRVGLAWQLGERTVVRAGYGASQFMEGTGANLRLPQNPPFFFESNVTYDQTTGAGSLATGFEDLVPLDQPSGQVRAFDPELRPQLTQQWNVFVEYRLTSSLSASVGYVGHRATRLATPLEGNQPLPGEGDPSTWAPLEERRPLYATAPLLGNVSTTASRGRSNHNALQVSLRQRSWRGLEGLVSYTFGKTLSDNIGYYGSPYSANEGHYWMNAYRSDWNYGPAFFDVRHNLVVSAVWELPFGHGRRGGSQGTGLKGALLGGWKAAAIVQARSGIPVTIIDGRGSSLQAVRGGERPNCVGDAQPEHPTLDRWLDINGFAPAALGTWGDCGVGTARAPGYLNLDLGLSKRFSAGGGRFVELGAQAFNLTNTPSFGPPGRNIADVASFGRITNTVSLPRTIELMLKLYF